MEKSAPLITLTTDFGLADPYVGQLKGVLLTGCPGATLVDLTHAVPAWDVVAAAIAIHAGYGYFPQGTVHLIVVDPGVGSRRSILAAQGDGHFFVCPDNGILSLLVQACKIETVRLVVSPERSIRPISPTFHGRDIMAPVAAALARGMEIDELGPALALSDLHRIHLPVPLKTVEGMRGQVLSIDHFGNVRTTFRAEGDWCAPEALSVLEVNGQRIVHRVATYSDVPVGVLAMLIDSAGFLEIAANQANAASLIGCRPGDPVTMTWR